MNLELCTLHLHETTDLEEILSFLLFGDGCAAALVSAEPTGVRMDSFKAALIPDTAELIRWNIREQGFDMVLSGGVPGAIRSGLSRARSDILNGEAPIDLWAVHPGGRSLLDAVEAALELPPSALQVSRDILNDFGNMSSGTVMFVLDRLMRAAVLPLISWPAVRPRRGLVRRERPEKSPRTVRGHRLSRYPRP
jgi:predicted naringenin-chalcone synthase